MTNARKIVLLNTGGTFNKVYDPITGTLPVAEDAGGVTRLLGRVAHNVDWHLVDLMHKDSLDMTDADRAAIRAAISTVPSRWSDAPVLIVHGTDTMHQTADVLAQAKPDRVIVLTGAMRPVSIDPVEGGMHLALALGFLDGQPEAGVYIAMHGRVLPYDRITKDRTRGLFVPTGN